MSIVWAPAGLLAGVGNDLVVLDADRRLYVGLSRDGSYWHVVEPLQADVQDADGNVVRRAGDLACRCKGGTFHGSCYRVSEAEAFEAGDARAIAPAPAWLTPRDRLDAGVALFDSPAGAGESLGMETHRG